jgi:hypothetical protein
MVYDLRAFREALRFRCCQLCEEQNAVFPFQAISPHEYFRFSSHIFQTSLAPTKLPVTDKKAWHSQIIGQ